MSYLFLSVYLPVRTSRTFCLYHPTCLCRCYWLCLSLLLPAWQQHIRYEGLGLCVSEQTSLFLLLDHFHIFIFFILCKAASLEPHLTTDSMFSPLPSPFMSPLLYSDSSAPVPSPSSTSLHYCCICKSFERCKCNYVLRWQRCLQICVCVCVYCVSLCVAKCIIATYYVPVCLLETPTN